MIIMETNVLHFLIINAAILLRQPANTTDNLGPVARSLVSANRWLRGIKMYRFPWYLTLVSTNHASSNPGQTVSSFYRSSQASFSWYSLFYQSNAFLVEVISKTVSY